MLFDILWRYQNHHRGDVVVHPVHGPAEIRAVSMTREGAPFVVVRRLDGEMVGFPLDECAYG